MVGTQPDDGQYTGPKHVVVCTNLCDNNIQLCSDHIFNTFFSDYVFSREFYCQYHSNWELQYDKQNCNNTDLNTCVYVY